MYLSKLKVKQNISDTPTNVKKTSKMEIDLAYVDYTIAGLTSPNTVKSFQSVDPKNRSKVLK